MLSDCEQTQYHVRPCRKLASTAAELGGQPWLVSFSGMADVLGWPKRPPLVADADRAVVLASWAPYCGGIAPCQRFIPFGEVRNLSPEDFVRVLAHDLQVSPCLPKRRSKRINRNSVWDCAAIVCLSQQASMHTRCQEGGHLSQPLQPTCLWPAMLLHAKVSPFCSKDMIHAARSQAWWWARASGLATRLPEIQRCCKSSARHMAWTCQLSASWPVAAAKVLRWLVPSLAAQLYQK